MTQDRHIYTICGRMEVASDVISGQNLKPIEWYMVVNFEIASQSSLRENAPKLFWKDAGSDGDRQRW